MTRDEIIFNVFTGWFNSDLVDVDNPQEVEVAAASCAADLVRNLPDTQATITRLTEMLDHWTPALVLQFIHATDLDWLYDEPTEQALKHVLRLVTDHLRWYARHPPLL